MLKYVNLIFRTVLLVASSNVGKPLKGHRLIVGGKHVCDSCVTAQIHQLAHKWTIKNTYIILRSFLVPYDTHVHAKKYTHPAQTDRGFGNRTGT